MAYLGLQGSLPRLQLGHSFGDIHIRSAFLFHLADEITLKHTSVVRLESSASSSEGQIRLSADMFAQREASERLTLV